MSQILSVYHDPEIDPDDSPGEYETDASDLDSSLLDIDLLSVDSTCDRSPGQRYLHRAHRAKRELWHKALIATEKLTSVLNRYRSCGTRGAVIQSPSTSAIRLQVHCCGQRVCPHCGRVSATDRAQKIRQIMGHVKPNEWRFITLTIQSTDAPLAEQLQFLRKSFRRLRQQLIWTDTQKGGWAVIEVTWNNVRKQWHPHLHILAQGKFIPQKELATAWQQASAGSYVVDIRAVDESQGSVKELTKYAGKCPPLELEENAEELAIEYYTATKGRRMVLPFGNVIGQGEIEVAESGEPDPGDWVVIASLDDLVLKTIAGNAHATSLLDALRLCTTISRCGP